MYDYYTYLTQEEISKNARRKYRDAIRGKEYQEELMSYCTSGSEEYENLYSRRKIYVQDIALLEDVFGTRLLQTDNITREI